MNYHGLQTDICVTHWMQGDSGWKPSIHSRSVKFGKAASRNSFEAFTKSPRIDFTAKNMQYKTELPDTQILQESKVIDKKDGSNVDFIGTSFEV